MLPFRIDKDLIRSAGRTHNLMCRRCMRISVMEKESLEITSGFVHVGHVGKLGWGFFVIVYGNWMWSYGSVGMHRLEQILHIDNFSDPHCCSNTSATQLWIISSNFKTKVKSWSNPFSFLNRIVNVGTTNSWLWSKQPQEFPFLLGFFFFFTDTSLPSIVRRSDWAILYRVAVFTFILCSHYVTNSVLREISRYVSMEVNRSQFTVNANITLFGRLPQS